MRLAKDGRVGTAVEPVPLNQAVVEELRGSISGRLLEPGDAGCDEARSIWNGAIDRRPP